MRIKVKIEIIGLTKPLVWREMWIPMDITFHKFHMLIQAGMGWKNYHLYQFGESRTSRYFIIKSPYAEEMAGINAKKVPVADFLLDYFNSVNMARAMDRIPDERIYYTYDFGDNWEHNIDILDFEQSDNTNPEITDGGGACPPEDCGGIHGYNDLIKNLASGKRKAQEALEWLDVCGYKDFDPGVFDMDEAQMRVKKVK
ncbi:MAG: plasmid pRiA4b ORF-3 family protein [Lewinellaceae bacterium]|nr:plasmid pRiA4b ORF-3 family protein [Lewinellaceae bacterium]